MRNQSSAARRRLVFLLSCTQLVVLTAAAQSDSLLVYYPFDGTADDASGNAFHGSINGATLTSDRSGALDGAYAFDGVDDHIAMPQVWRGSDRLTFGAWFSVAAGAEEGKVVYHGFNGEFQLLATDTSAAVGVHTTQVSADWSFVGAKIEAERWYAIVGVWERGRFLTLYLNGSAIDSVAVPDDPLLNVGFGFPSSVGSYSRTAGAYFKGSIDEVRIYDRRLSPSAIAALYGTSVGTEDEIAREAESIALTHYPNPLSGLTTIEFDVSRSSQIELDVFDVRGALVRRLQSGSVGAGRHSVSFAPGGLPSGVYFYRLRTDRSTKTNRLVLLR